MTALSSEDGRIVKFVRQNYGHPVARQVAKTLRENTGFGQAVRRNLLSEMKRKEKR